jgi:predicted MarR family transcription regulator
MTALLWLIFSTLGGIEVAKAPPAAAQQLLNEGLITPVQAAHAVYYQVTPTGYARFVRL